MLSSWIHWLKIASILAGITSSGAHANPALLSSRQEDAPANKASSSAEQILADGIDYYTLAQQGSIAVLTSMSNMEAGGPTDPDSFAAAKDSLTAFMALTTRIRGNAQKLAKVNPVVTRNLMKMQQSQVLEYAQLQYLNNTPTDLPVLQKLMGNIQAGIETSKGLKSAALGGSDIPGSVAPNASDPSAEPPAVPGNGQMSEAPGAAAAPPT